MNENKNTYTPPKLTAKQFLTTTGIFLTIITLLFLFLKTPQTNKYTEEQTKEMLLQEKSSIEEYTNNLLTTIRENENTITRLQEENKSLNKQVEDSNKRLKAIKELIGTADSTPESAVPPSNKTSDVGNPEIEFLMQKFGLRGCRFTNDQHHLSRINTSWYGYDFACIKGEPFQVTPPSDGYIIEHNAYDKNLGNYIILKKNNTRIVLGHILSPLKPGTETNQYTILGTTDSSGSSSNIHLHIEFWHNETNVSYHYALGLPYQELHPKTLLIDRGFNFSNQVPPPTTIYTTEQLYTKVCNFKPTSPLCKDEQLFKELHQITTSRSEYPYLFPILLGISNAESSLGTNYFPSHCHTKNNLGGIKWRIDDNNNRIKDQPIPDSNGCFLYQFKSVQDYWVSKTNSIRFGYKTCLQDSPIKTLECISMYYVGTNKQVKTNWVKNASIFLY